MANPYGDPDRPKGPRLRNTLFSALTGRDADVSGSTDGDVGQMLAAAYGTRSDGRLDTAAAAKGMGVSQRTVQRWIASEGRQHTKPSKTNLTRLATKARQAATTKRGRARAVKAAQTGPLARRGGDLMVSGIQGPLGKQYTRPRPISTPMSPEEVDGMYAAYIEGGDQGLIDWYTDQQIVNNYGMSDWVIEDVDTWEFDPR